jgi:hypothetical protein
VNGLGPSVALYDIIIIIIISPPQSTTGHRPLQLHAISRFGYSHPAPRSRPAQIVTLPDLKASYATRLSVSTPELVSPTVIGSTTDTAGPLPLQRANTVCYFNNFSSLPDHSVSDSIPQRNSEHGPAPLNLDLIRQPCKKESCYYIVLSQAAHGITRFYHTASYNTIIRQTFHTFKSVP